MPALKMTPHSLSRLWMGAFVLALFLSAGTSHAQAPVVDRVEPANWWTGMHWSEVQLMLYGENLDQITARSANEGVRVTGVTSVPNDGYAFVDVEINSDASPGTYPIEIVHAGGTTTVEFPVLEREPREGRAQGFSSEDAVYLITPDRFANADTTNDVVPGLRDEYDPSDPGMRHGGDLQGIIERLDYLKNLGVTTLWLNPVLENAGRNSYHGYAATDLYRVDPRFGSNDDYRRLVDKAHERGMKVIFDHVSNHIGIEHPWIGDLPRESWLNGSVEEHASQKHYKMSITDPHADPRSETLLRTFWFVDAMPDLNQRDPLLATYLIQNTLWWIETTGLDGIREDTYPYPDQAFLARWAEAIRTEYPGFDIVGEIWDTAPAFTAVFQEGTSVPRDFETNLPSVMDFALSTAYREYVSGDGGLGAVYQVIAQDFLYGDPQMIMTLADNHDMPRIAFLAENAADPDAARERMMQVLTMLFTSRGIPQILYGTEIGMVGGPSHVELREDVPGGFPGDERSAFTESGRTDAENEIFDHVQTLLRLRSEHPALTRGTLTHYPPTYGNEIYRYVRRYDGEEGGRGAERVAREDDTVLVLVNGHDEPRRVDLKEVFGAAPNLQLTDLMTGRKAEVLDGPSVRVEARSAAVLQVDGE